MTHDDDARPMLEAARPQGSGYQRVDRPLVDEMAEMVRTGTATSWAAAALAVVGRAHGIGSDEAKVRRLVQLAKAIHGELSPESHLNSVILPSPGPGESDSIAGMSTAPTPATAQPDLATLQAALAGLAGRVAALEAQGAEREAAVAALTTRAVESDLMLAQVIEDRSEIVRELVDTREAFERQEQATERYVGLTELRLARLGASRAKTVTEH